MNGDFYRLYYSDDIASFNGITLYFKLNKVNVLKYFKKYKITFNWCENKVVLNHLVNLEKNILDAFEGKVKMKNKHILDQITNGFLKIISSDEQTYGSRDTFNLQLKISGIWESDRECGLTFRFFSL